MNSSINLFLISGSGTTGLAAKNLNRNYILIEKELKWVEVIKKRIPDIDIISEDFSN
jgi:DNA modification methylase